MGAEPRADYTCDWDEVSSGDEWKKYEWALAMGGATIFVIVSKVMVFDQLLFV